MFCDNCGSVIPYGVNKCPKCGRSISNNNDQSTNSLSVAARPVKKPCVETESVLRCDKCGARVKSNVGTCEICGSKLLGHTFTTVEPSSHAFDHGAHKNAGATFNFKEEVKMDKKASNTVVGVFVFSVIFIIIVLSIIFGL